MTRRRHPGRKLGLLHHIEITRVRLDETSEDQTKHTKLRKAKTPAKNNVETPIKLGSVLIAHAREYGHCQRSQIFVKAGVPVN